MSYIVTSVNVVPLQETISLVQGGNIIKPPGPTSVKADFTVEILDHTGYKLNTLDGFAEFLKGNSHPWANSDMIEKALRETYPERFL